MRCYHRLVLRRWDLLALVALLGMPFAALGVYIAASCNVSSLVEQLDRWLVELEVTTPRGDAVNLEPLNELAEHPLSDTARDEVDAVLAGTKAPWEVSTSTLAELLAHERIIAPLDASLTTSTARSRPLTAKEELGAADLGREFAFFAINTRSRGLAIRADVLCVHGYSLAMRLGGGGGLDDASVAAAIFGTVNDACFENMGTAHRDARLAAIHDVLRLAPTTPRVVNVLERDRAWRLLRMYQRTVGPVPEALAARLPSPWILDPDDTLTVSFATRLLGRLAIHVAAAASTEAIARESTNPRGPPPHLLPPFEDKAASFRHAITAARAAEDLERSTWRMLLARLVAEVFVIDHKRWPTTAAELHLDDKVLDERVQAAMHPQSLDLIEHGEHLSLILDGQHNVRATLPDDLLGLARQPMPARDFTGRLLEPQPREARPTAEASSKKTP